MTDVLNKKRRKPTFIDLFCGAGGLSLGFEKAGFDLLFANDKDKHSILTFKNNRKKNWENRIVCSDIDNFLINYKEKIKTSGCDVVIGGPPCQSFSMANRQRIIDDPRNALYKKFVLAVSIIKPKIVVMENVRGMLRVADQVVEDFKKIGFIMDYKILNAKDFGIPQNRSRLIYIGLKKNGDSAERIKKIFQNIEKSKEKNEVPLREALWGLRKLKAKKEKNAVDQDSKDSGFFKDTPIFTGRATKYVIEINNHKTPKLIYNHKARYNNERDLEIYKLLPQGGKSDHPKIAHIMPYKNRASIFKDKFYKLTLDSPSKTITSHMKFDCHMYIHPLEIRGLTPREAARIQSFPDNYVFYGPLNQWYNQIGNAVPPKLAEFLGKNIKKALIQ